jgi:DNA-binding CsgD family transcriptional regulator
MEQLMGRHAESRARLERAYRDLDVPASAAGVSILVALTAASLFLSEQHRMLEWGRMAVSAASGLGDDALLAAALAAHAMGAAFASDEGVGPEAVEVHDRCSRLVDSMPDEAVVRRLDALSNLTMSELYLDRYVLGCHHGERALMLARATGQTHLLPTLSPILGMSLAMVGEMERSAQVLDDAIEAARLVGDAQGLCMNLFNRELSAVLAGDVDTALGIGGESLELARKVDSAVITAFAGAIHAQAVLESGNPRAARDLLLDSVGGDQIPLLAGSWRAHFLEVLTRCLLGAGDPDGAESAAQRLEDQSHTLGLTQVMAHRAAAEVALAQQRLDDAVRSARGALREAEGIAARAHVPVARALLGRSLAAWGSEGEAVEQLLIAAAEFEGLGAARHRSEVESELRRLGHTTAYHRSTPGKREGSGIEALTGREMEVALLVLDRRTNREIANELFLSTKTVESHIRNIFTKLGVSSRVEIARRVVAARNG